jgi:2-amino-4-hydroxy-6-hydroxymethyldihydropteridine diphosphokinase
VRQLAAAFFCRSLLRQAASKLAATQSGGKSPHSQRRATMETVVYLSLGSNVGNRGGNLRRAIEELRRSGIAVRRVSSFYETEPVDVPDQPWFVNCVVEVETDQGALELLRALQAIEQHMGRVRTTPRGPRTVDLDILFFGGAVMDTPELTIPHPRLEGRRFVLEPLNEIAPELRDPATGWPVAEMLSALQDSWLVRRLPREGEAEPEEERP